MTKLFNIHSLISFELINKTGKKMLESLNPEYKYFQSEKKCSNHFQIIVNKNNSKIHYSIKKNRKEWEIDLASYLKNKALEIYPKSLGRKDSFSFLVFKNIYARSLLSLQLLNSNASLLHSCAFKIGAKSYIFAGRPGVFKTSILMDAIRHYNAEFIGEENCLIYNSKVYSFPLNIDSIAYKIKNYTSENASGKIQKIKLGIHLLKNIKSKNQSLSISSSCNIQNIFYLSKGNEFNIQETKFENILPNLIDNELKELSIPPTHSLSGINYNFFKESIENYDPKLIKNFTQNLESIFRKNFSDARFFIVTSPKEYTKSITDSLIRFMEK